MFFFLITFAIFSSFFFFQAEDGIRDLTVTGVQTCALPIFPFGRVFRIDPKGQWDLVVQYDGWPNGLKIHKGGWVFIADYKRGLMLLDPKSGKIESYLATAFSEGFKGLNDLHFADNGDLYFTDQGQTGIADPSGRVYRLRVNGELQRIVDNAPSPNGITLNT